MKNLYFIFKKLTLSKLSKIIFEKDHDLYFAYQSYAILFLAIPFYIFKNNKNFLTLHYIMSNFK